MSSTEITLDNGKILKVTMAPFGESKELYQCVLRSMKDIKFDDQAEIDASFFKDIFCEMLSSKEIETALWTCMGRATYDKLKITLDTFEDEKAREDYIRICYEVAWVNIAPFTKGLYAKFSPMLDKVKKFLP